MVDRAGEERAIHKGDCYCPRCMDAFYEWLRRGSHLQQNRSPVEGGPKL